MRKLVLLLLCIALFSYCPKENNYPLIDLITTNQVLDDVKQLFQTDHDEANHAAMSKEEHSLAGLINRATNAFNDNISEPLRQVLQGESDAVEPKDQQALDLSLPELSDNEFGNDFNGELEVFAGQQENTLPDLFSAPKNTSNSKGSRASIGGRLLLDEQNPNYTMDSVLGAEVSLELKTH